MRIVIDIDEARFKDIQRIAEVQLESNHFKTAEQIIANGTPIEQEPCEDCISRQAAIDAINNNRFRYTVAKEDACTGNVLWDSDLIDSNVAQDILNLPFVNPQAKTGHWIEVVDEIDSFGNKTWHHECSICGNSNSGWGENKYCPNCGSKMSEVEQ